MTNKNTKPSISKVGKTLSKDDKDDDDPIAQSLA